MKIILNNLKDNPRTLIRRAGYGEHRDNRSGETSYHRRLGPNIFPNFHVYLSEDARGVEISLHLDQKQPSYGSGHMHSGDYEGPVIENEMMRLKEVFLNAPAPENDENRPKKGFFSKLFG